MVTQVYSLQYPDEALDCIRAGVDNVGLLLGDDMCPAALTLEQARRVFDAVGKLAVKVAILMHKEEEAVIEVAERLRPDVVHLCNTVYATPEFTAKLRRRIPGIKIMQAVAVTGDEAIAEAKKYEGYADFLMLDSVAVGVNDVGATLNGIGAAGVTHDWNISKRIVDEVNIPVFLAGGLGADNVYEAVVKVRPYGVDSLTKTTKIENGVYIRKDIEKVRAFVENARRAARDV